jgi:hypothetical protein
MSQLLARVKSRLIITKIGLAALDEKYRDSVWYHLWGGESSKYNDMERSNDGLHDLREGIPKQVYITDNNYLSAW